MHVGQNKARHVDARPKGLQNTVVVIICLLYISLDLWTMGCRVMYQIGEDITKLSFESNYINIFSAVLFFKIKTVSRVVLFFFSKVGVNFEHF